MKKKFFNILKIIAILIVSQSIAAGCVFAAYDYMREFLRNYYGFTWNSYTSTLYNKIENYSNLCGFITYVIVNMLIFYKFTIEIAKEIYVGLYNYLYVPTFNFLSPYYIKISQKFKNSRFIIFTKKYHIHKILFFTFIVFYLLQHSKLTESTFGSISGESKFYKNEIIYVDTSKTIYAEFTFKSVLRNKCQYKKAIEINNYKTNRDEYNSMIFCEPHLIDNEILYLKATLKDMRTIFLLGFLFDYDKLFEN
jgi:hypothetical protein